MYRYHLHAVFDRNLPEAVYKISEEKSTIDVMIPIQREDGALKYGLQRIADELKKEKIYPTEEGFDAIILGLMVYMADMKISRKKQSQDSWTREIELSIPVFSEKWDEHQATIEQMLKFLTGDLWKVNLIKRETIFAEGKEGKTDKYEIASLFSGGMDSLIASINYMEQKRATLFVSHAGGETRVRTWQTNLLSEIDRQYPEVAHGNAYYKSDLSEINFPEAGSDLNQRSRSFLFISIAMFAISGTKSIRTLYMPENGLIALNVPLDNLRIGSHSTRTTHPFYLQLWNVISRSMFGFDIVNPYWNKTKGEMAKECLNQDLLKKMVALSYSCSSVNTAQIFSHHSQHCGHCLPCIIRRAAMHAAFGEYDPSEYMDDSVREMQGNRSSEGEQLRSFEYAIARLKKNPNAARILIYKPGPLRGSEEYLSQLSDVYARGLLEVDKWIRDSLEKENAN